MLNSRFVKELETKFMNHYQSFMITDSEVNWNFKMKVNHTRRVRTNTQAICNQLGLSEYDTLLAETVAILHDIGRFTQYSRYNTFKDAESCDHAEMGLQVIRENNFLTSLDKNEIHLIETAVSYHNNKDLPQNLEILERLFCELIRDADKLDILDLVIGYYENSDIGNQKSLELSLPNDSSISEQVYNDLYNGCNVNLQDVKNLNDFKLLQVGWIFDINFPFTLVEIIRNRYIERLFEQIDCDTNLDILQARIYKLIDERINLGSA